MRLFITRLVLSLLTVLTLAASAVAQPPCAPRKVLIERLTTKFGEAPELMGLAANNHLLELFASRENGSWTILMTRPDGISCLMASGSAFETVEQVPPGKPA